MQSNGIGGKINGDFSVSKEIESKQAFNSALRRKVMTDHIHVFDLESKALEYWNLDDWHKGDSAGRGDFNMPTRFGRIDADSQGGLNGNHRNGRSCIHSQLKKYRPVSIDDICFTQDELLRRLEFEFTHVLKSYVKSCRISFGKPVFGIFHEDIAPSLQRKKLSVDFVSVVAVRDQFSRDRDGGGFVDLFYGD